MNFLTNAKYNRTSRQISNSLVDLKKCVCVYIYIYIYIYIYLRKTYFEEF